jgi:putative DNA primase/helicase
LGSHFGPGIDLKQRGGYVLAPSSNHKSGGTYEWQEPQRDVALAPAWLTLLSTVRKEMPDAPAPKPDASELDDYLRGRLDRAIEIVTPHYTLGSRHTLALALGGYCRNRRLPESAAVYLVSQLPSADPEERINAARWAYGEGVSRPAGASQLPAELLRELDALALYPRGFQRTAALRRAADDSSADAAENERDERATDLGNARRLVRLHGAGLRYCSARGVWLVWDGKRWAEDETGAAERAAKASAESLWSEVPSAEDRAKAAKHAAAAQSAKSLSAAIALAKTEPEIAVRVNELDADPWLLNVQNGTLDLRTRALRDPDPALRMTKICGTEYQAKARSDLWDRFVERTFGGDRDLIAYVQRALGYSLLGEWREKAFWFGYGPPDGAKSTFFHVVMHALGDYAVTAAASTWMVQSSSGGNRGDLVRLHSSRLVTTSEIRRGMRVDEENVKRVTGGDPIVAAAKYEGEIEFRPKFALWWFANDPPIIRDDDTGMWARARVVPFTCVVPKAEQDKDLPSKLTSPEHAPAVLAWLVEGFCMWQEHGLGTCAAVERATQRYRDEMNPVAEFAAEHLVITGHRNSEIPCRYLRKRFEAWAIAEGKKWALQGGRAFGERLRELVGPNGERITGGPADDSTKKEVAPQYQDGEAGSYERTYRRGEKDRHWRGVFLKE